MPRSKSMISPLNWRGAMSVMYEVREDWCGVPGERWKVQNE